MSNKQGSSDHASTCYFSQSIAAPTENLQPPIRAQPRLSLPLEHGTEGKENPLLAALVEDQSSRTHQKDHTSEDVSSRQSIRNAQSQGRE